MSATINLDIAKRVDVVCRKGDTFSMSITMTDSLGDPMNVSQHSFKMQVRPYDLHGNSDSATATIEISTDENGGITVASDNTNVIDVVISATKMGSIDSGLYVYDFQSSLSAVVTTWLYGTFKVNEDITI